MSCRPKLGRSGRQVGKRGLPWFSKASWTEACPDATTPAHHPSSGGASDGDDAGGGGQGFPSPMVALRHAHTV